ncbi:MAG TPA: hypothetical protein VIX81_01235, partial [Gammaproteobacteria bacterium]
MGAILLAGSSWVGAASVILAPSMDNSIYDDVGFVLSNGKGPGLYSGCVLSASKSKAVGSGACPAAAGASD